MNKTELVNELSRRLDIPQNKCRHYLNTLLDIVGDDLTVDDYLTLQGFGTFNLWKQTRRTGRNPRTGQEVTIQPRNSVKFKPGKDLLKKINDAEHPDETSPFAEK
ncbi:HU family DNA-binding protein [Parabacteroides sp.]